LPSGLLVLVVEAALHTSTLAPLSMLLPSLLARLLLLDAP